MNKVPSPLGVAESECRKARRRRLIAIPPLVCKCDGDVVMTVYRGPTCAAAGELKVFRLASMDVKATS